MAGYNFDEQSARRVVKSTLFTERMNRGGGASPSTPANLNQVWWPFRNDYAGTVPSYGVVAITGVVAVTDTTSTIYTGNRPSTTFYQLYGVNSSLEVAEGEYGLLTLNGPCYIAYDSGTPAAGEGWGPKPGQFTLSKGFPSGTIVSGIQDTTNKWLLGTLAPITKILCKATADNAAGSLATDTSDYKIQSGTAGSEADAGFTTQPAIYARESTSNNEFFTASFANNAWYADIETGRILMYKAKLNGALADTDANATIDNATCFGGGTAPSPTSAANTLDLAGSDNDDCVIIKDGTGYYLINVMHHAC